MKHLLLPFALEQSADRVNPTTVYGWVEKFGEQNDYCSLHSGRSGYATTDDVTFIKFKEYLTEKIENYTPRFINKKEPEQKNSVVSSSADYVSQLESSIKALRQMGYTVHCAVQAPAKKL